MSDPKNALKNKSSKSRKLSSSEDSDSDYHDEKIVSNIVIPESDHEESGTDVSSNMLYSDDEKSEDLGTNDTTAGSASEIITDDDDNVSRNEANIKSSQPTRYSTPTFPRSSQKNRRSLGFKSAIDSALDESGDSEFQSFPGTPSQEVESPNPKVMVPSRDSSSRHSLSEGNNAYLHSTASSISSISLTQDEENDGPPNANEDNFIETVDSDDSDSKSVNTVNDVIETIDSDSSDCVPVDGGHILAEEATLDTVEDVTLPLSSPGTNFVDGSIAKRYDVDKRLSLTPPSQSSYNASVQDPRQENRFIDLTQSDGSLQNSPIGARMPLPVQKSSRSIADIVSKIAYLTQEVNSKEALLENVNVKTLPDRGQNLMIKITDLKNQKYKLEQELARNTEYNDQKAALEEYQLKKKTASILKTQTTLKFDPVVKSEPREYVQEDMIDEIENSPKSAKGSSKMPDWGDLPQPDMTISNFGKQAMKTHITEKTLTMEALATLHKALKNCPGEDTLAEDPKRLKVELMPHQKHGLAWMLWREQERPSGGILADDMGLGKTLSMISLILKCIEMKEEESGGSEETSESEDDSPQWISKRYSRKPKGGTLVVCPASLMGQWEKEICKRVKRKTLSVECYHGTKRETNPRRLAQYDVVITTYNLMSRESGVDKNDKIMNSRGPIHSIKWERVILDEAHVVRNHKSLMCIGVCELEAKHRWCLTGTPIQNKELDLYALLKFLRCAPFDDITLWKKWVDNKNASGMQRLNTMMKSLMLRRTKEQLYEKGDLNCLPKKNQEVIDVHLDPEELEIYEKVAVFSSQLFSEFLHQRAEKQQVLDARYGFCNKPTWEQQERPDNQFTTTKELAALHRKLQGADIKTHQILVLLLRLRQICCHPGLVKKMVESGDLDLDVGIEDESGVDVDLFSQMNKLNINDDIFDKKVIKEERENHAQVLSIDNPVLSLDRASAKIRALLDTLEGKVLKSDDKAIIVSQWTSVLNIVSKFLDDKDVKYDSLTGEVAVHKRQDLMNAFNQRSHGPQVLLLSLTAGGVGLNLVGANHLFLVDIHWNPQLENQACDRIYRVGQKKDVFVYRFITVNTIEERIKCLQEKKLALADSVLTGTMRTNAAKLTLDDLKMLFAVPKAPAPAPAPAPRVV